MIEADCSQFVQQQSQDVLALQLYRGIDKQLKKQVPLGVTATHLPQIPSGRHHDIDHPLKFPLAMREGRFACG